MNTDGTITEPLAGFEKGYRSNSVTVLYAENIPSRMWIAAVLIAMQSFQFGYALSCLNSALITGDSNNARDCYDGSDNSCPQGTIYNDLDMSAIEAQLATSLAVLGAWIGCYVGSQPAEKYGRKSTIMWNNLFFFSGGMLTVLRNIYALYAGRFLVGLGVGVESVVVPVLLSEIASDETRGTITTLHQLLLTVGIFLSGVIGYGVVNNVDHGWEYLQGGIMIPSIIMVLCYKLIPESPKWLLLNNRESEAKEVLIPLRDADADINRELKAIANDVLTKGGKVDKGHDDTDDVTWSEVFKAKKAMTIGCGLMFMSAMSGVNTVIFYSTTIFDFAGFHESILATASVGAINLITTAYSAYFIDRYGRKTLLLIGMYSMLGSLCCLSIILVSPVDESIQGVIAVLATLWYVFGFAVGLGSVAWVVMSEICPIRIRTKAFSLFVSINWMCNLVIGLLTLSAIDGLGGVDYHNMDDDEIANAQKNGVAYLYFLFAGICFFSLIFVRAKVPETKGMVVQNGDLEDLLGGGGNPLLGGTEHDITASTLDSPSKLDFKSNFRQ